MNAPARNENNPVTPFRRISRTAVAAMFAAAFCGAAAGETIIKTHGLSIFGDLKYPPDFEHFDYVNPDAPKGGTMSTWGFGTFDQFSPFIVAGNPEYYAATLGILSESLMTRAYDEPDAVYGLIAESAEYPESQQWIIFNMRPEARFFDGTPVTAEDVIFSFEALSEHGRPAYRNAYQDFVAVEALNPHRVKFTFREGVPLRDLPLNAAGMPILSKAHYAGKDFATSTIDQPLSSAQYVVEFADPGRRVVYRRNEDYWGKSLPVRVGHGNFDRIVIEYFADYTAAFEGFKGGVYDFREEFLSKLWATSYDFPEVVGGIVRIDNVPDGRPAGTQGFWINTRRDKFSDPRVREAIQLAFNFEWSNETLFYGIYARTDSFWENSFLQAQGMPSPEELVLLEQVRDHLPAAVFDEPAYIPAVSEPRRLDRAILKRASELLDEAGWTLVDGIRTNAEGETLSLELLHDSPSFDRVINPYIETLKQLGIDAVNTRVDPAQERQRISDLDFDMMIRRYVMSLTPGNELRELFGSWFANAPDTNNVAGVSNPGIDFLIEKIETAKTREDLIAAVKALDRSLRALHIWVPNWYKAVHNVAYRDHYRRPEVTAPYRMGALEFWWFDEEIAESIEQRSGASAEDSDSE